MSDNLNPGDLAIVIGESGGANNVRSAPVVVPNCGNCVRNPGIPEHAVLLILPKPENWAGAYPHKDATHTWWYVRGRTETKLPDGRFEVIEGWTAANENGKPFLTRMESAQACLDTMGTALDTHLSSKQEAYVLPPDGLNIRKEADPLATRIGGLLQGTVVTVTGSPACDTKMVWWQIKPLNSPGPSGWASEGSGLISSIQEWFLVPLTLE